MNLVAAVMAAAAAAGCVSILANTGIGQYWVVNEEKKNNQQVEKKTRNGTHTHTLKQRIGNIINILQRILILLLLLRYFNDDDEKRMLSEHLHKFTQIRPRHAHGVCSTVRSDKNEN